MTQDDLAALIALLHVKTIGPARVRWLTEHQPPATAVESLRAGRVPPDVGPAPRGVNQEMIWDWAKALRAIDGHSRLEDHQNQGVEVMFRGHRHWPFHDDPDPPSLIFASGNLALALAGTRVGIVGTRRCTSIGRQTARRLGADLAAKRDGSEQVSIVSGLAAGIDAEAHRGTLAVAGQPIGVVASGLDVPYPKSNSGLWEEVAKVGLLISESPLGVRPERWKFPARNRLIASLSHLVVVVESHASGGALSTADEAANRGITVGAVPGSVTSSSATGTNALLADGCLVIRDANDVLVELGLPLLSRPEAASPTGAKLRSTSAPAAGPPNPESFPAPDRQILEAVLQEPVHLDHLLLSLAASRSEIFAAVQRLTEQGVLAQVGSRLEWKPR